MESMPLSPFPRPIDLGYTGSRSVVAFYWMPGADELAIDDGQTFTCGMGNNHLFLEWLRENNAMTSLEIGDSDTEAKNVILVDLDKGTAALVEKTEALRSLRDAYRSETGIKTSDEIIRQLRERGWDSL